MTAAGATSSMSPTTSTRTMPSQASSSTITITSRPRPRPLKKAVKPLTPPNIQVDIPHHVSGLDDSDLSPLTPTSSPFQSRNAQAFPRLSPERTPIASSSQTKKSAKTENPRKRATKFSLKTWDLSQLGTNVWVLIDHRARVLEPDNLKETDKDWIWWPGKVTSAKRNARPLRVALANPSSFDVKSVEISDPCESNVVSWMNSAGRIRYSEPVFTNHTSLGSVHASPRKKQKLNREGLKRQWRLAVEELDDTISNKPASSKKAPASSTKKVDVSRAFPFPQLDDSYDSDLPEVGTEEFRTFPPSVPSSPAKGISAPTSSQRKTKRKRSPSSDVDSDDDVIDVVAPRWSPRPPDISITIPGELVLAIEKASDSLYWPARVLDYLPADKPTKPDKYSVEFLDGKSKSIPRHWFYIAEEEKFATCKLGEWDSTVVEVRNDEDGDSPLEQDYIPERTSSPLPTIPPPSTEDFKLLSIREQFAYTKTILSAILNENFPPAMQRHTNFIAGGSKRKSVVEEAGLRGHMDPRDVDALQSYVTEWCLRDEQRAQVITDEEDISAPLSRDMVNLNDHAPLSIDRSVSPAATEILSEADLPPTSSFAVSEGTRSIAHIDVDINLPRQYGCEAFEALSRSEKNDYCLNVLLPEAILQILLWRTGERTSLDLLGDREEATLHAKGLELLRASDWVNDVMRLRMTAVGQLGKSKRNGGQSKKDDDDEVLYSITGRPRRGVGVPKSYLE